MVFCQEFRGSDQYGIPIYLRLNASARNRFELAVWQQGELAISRTLHNGACQRML